MKNVAFWEVMPCGSVRTDISEESNASIIRVERISELVIADVVPMSLILSIKLQILQTTRLNPES
jgi:hypothetical protein